MSPLVLASASPRRTQLLDTLGVEHRIRPADIDETPLPGERPVPYVRRVARAKAAAVAVSGTEPVLAADTIVVHGGRILGKPAGREDALRMLAALSGTAHLVITAVAVEHGPRRAAALAATRVWFRSVSVQEAQQYWDSGEPRDKAGGYGIQGAASAFVTRLEGSYSNVVGLPLTETRALLAGLSLLAV